MDPSREAATKKKPLEVTRFVESPDGWKKNKYTITTSLKKAELSVRIAIEDWHEGAEVKEVSGAFTVTASMKIFLNEGDTIILVNTTSGHYLRLEKYGIGGEPTFLEPVQVECISETSSFEPIKLDSILTSNFFGDSESQGGLELTPLTIKMINPWGGKIEIRYKRWAPSNTGGTWSPDAGKKKLKARIVPKNTYRELVVGDGEIYHIVAHLEGESIKATLLLLERRIHTYVGYKSFGHILAAIESVTGLELEIVALPVLLHEYNAAVGAQTNLKNLWLPEMKPSVPMVTTLTESKIKEVVAKILESHSVKKLPSDIKLKDTVALSDLYSTPDEYVSNAPSDFLLLEVDKTNKRESIVLNGVKTIQPESCDLDSNYRVWLATTGVHITPVLLIVKKLSNGSFAGWLRKYKELKYKDPSIK